MLEAAVALFRFVQFAGAALLFGLPLFLLLVLPPAATEARWMNRVPRLAALAVLAGTLLGVVAQTGVLAGSLQDGLQPDALKAVLTQMDFGISSAVRLLLAAATLLLVLLLPPGRPAWRIAALGGGFISASMAWMGHGGATKGGAGIIHTAADIIHLLAAAGWIGALAGFSLLLLDAQTDPRQLARALGNFAGIGAGLVALILATGLVNSYFLVGLQHLSGLWTTPYGRLLSLKLLLFAVMLGLAARNRFFLSPALDRALSAKAPALSALRLSILSETAAAAAVLAIVAVLGMLEPIAQS